MNQITERIKAFFEKWQHRLQGHMLLTVKAPNGHVTSYWITDVYTSENGAIMADFYNGDDPDIIGYKSTFLDITITGA